MQFDVISMICCYNQACCESTREAHRVCPMISPQDGRVSYLTDAPVEAVALCRSAGELGERTEKAADAKRVHGMLFPRLARKLMSVDFWISRRGGVHTRHPLEDGRG